MHDITTPRLRLEPLREEHAGEFIGPLQDERIYEYVPTNAPTDAADLRRTFRRLEGRTSPDGSEDWLNWAIRCTSTDQCIGYVQATISPHLSASIAYVLFPAYWGRGYAREAVNAMLEFLAASLGIRDVRASVDPDNQKSIALLESIGFGRHAVHRSTLPIKGVLRDEIEYYRSISD